MAGNHPGRTFVPGDINDGILTTKMSNFCWRLFADKQKNLCKPYEM